MSNIDRYQIQSFAASRYRSNLSWIDIVYLVLIYISGLTHFVGTMLCHDNVH